MSARADHWYSTQRRRSSGRRPALWAGPKYSEIHRPARPVHHRILPFFPSATTARSGFSTVCFMRTDSCCIRASAAALSRACKR